MEPAAGRLGNACPARVVQGKAPEPSPPAATRDPKTRAEAGAPCPGDPGLLQATLRAGRVRAGPARWMMCVAGARLKVSGHWRD